VTTVDQLDRPLRCLRISVTDRCNLRCNYCMPEPDYVWLPKPELLDFDEICRLAHCFSRVGVDRIRITGGEPLLRRDLSKLVHMLAATPCITDLSITTNGVLLAEQARGLADAGLDRITVSLDTLRADRFEQLTRRRDLDKVLNGIDEARHAGLGERMKIDAVVLRGINDDELLDLLDFGTQVGAEVRFIEYMDVGGATQWTPQAVVSRDEMLSRIAEGHGPATALANRGPAPAERFVLSNGTVFGIIASTSAPFCASCDRSRVTADGSWYHCLYASDGFDLKRQLRSGQSDDDIVEGLVSCWQRRHDRGAEQRAGMTDRRSFVPVEALRADPRLEMHTRGG